MCVREKAKMIMANKDPLSDFKASKGWLQLFLRRKNFSLRRKTTECQKTPQDVIPKFASYILHFQRLQMVHKFANTAVYSMDETACWMDMPSSSTIDVHGARTVPLYTTGHKKTTLRRF